MGNQNSRNKKTTYKIPPGAGKPEAPSKPTVEYIGEDVMVRWSEPIYNGGCPVIGYLLQFNRVDGSNWESYRVNGTECLLKNLDDTFVFRVVAENLLGYSEPSETSVPVSFEFSEPVLLVPLNNQNRAIEFEKVELSCRIWGMPIPDVIWYLNGDEILANERIYMQSDGIDYKITFNHIKSSDEGEIRAIGKNLLGEVESTATIVVEAPPRIKVPKNYEEGIICRGGENLRLKFGYIGRPKPVFTFFHDGEPITGRYKTQEIGDVAILTLDNVTKEEGGEYSIRVENSVGVDWANVLVTVTDRPQPPGKPIVIQLSDNSCLLEWDQNSDDVNCYIVEYYRDGWGVWLKALTTRSRGCKIRDLIPGSKYRFRIKSENHFGISDGGEESVQIYIPDSNKEQGSVMSSIQEDEFEVVNDNIPEPSLKMNTKIPTILSQSKTKTVPFMDIKRHKIDPSDDVSIKRDVEVMKTPQQQQQHVQHERPTFKLSPNQSRNLSPVFSSVQGNKERRTNSLDRFTNRLLLTPSPESDKPMKKEPTLFSRNQIIGGSRSPNSLPRQQQQQQNEEPRPISAPGSVSDTKDRYYEQYSKTGKMTRGQDRFEKYRNKDSKSPNSMNPRHNVTLGESSNKELATSDLEPYQESSFLIVEDGGSDEEDEDGSVDFVVSQLVVPVKNGNVKISTSFDSGSVCASSVKSSTDDLSFDFLTRNNTPDVPLNEHHHHHQQNSMLAGDREGGENRGGGSGGSEQRDGSGNRINLLQSFAEFTNLTRGGGGGLGGGQNRKNNQTGMTLMKDGLDDDEDEDNEFFIRSSYTKGNKSQGVGDYHNYYYDNKNGGGGGRSRQEILLDSTSSLNKNNEGSTTNIDSSNQKLSDTNEETFANSSSSVHSLKSQIGNFVDSIVVLSFLVMLSPLLLMNVYTFVLFCLLLIKMTFM